MSLPLLEWLSSLASEVGLSELDSGRLSSDSVLAWLLCQLLVMLLGPGGTAGLVLDLAGVFRFDAPDPFTFARLGCRIGWSGTSIGVPSLSKQWMQTEPG